MNLAQNELFQNICASLNLTKASCVAILTFYGDASGKADKTNVAVAGHLARTIQWDNFCAEWSSILRAEGVKYFRRSQMEPPFFGEFSEKGWTVRHQIPILRKLHRVIKRNTIIGVGQSVKNRAFSELMPPKIKRALGGPYGWCVQACITFLARWASPRGDYVHYVFESGDDGEVEITKAIKSIFNDPNDREKFRVAGWTFAPKTGPGGLIRLQAADFLAYESYKQIENLLAGTKRPFRTSARDLVREKRDKLTCWTDRALLAWINKALTHPEIEEWWF